MRSRRGEAEGSPTKPTPTTTTTTADALKSLLSSLSTSPSSASGARLLHPHLLSLGLLLIPSSSSSSSPSVYLTTKLLQLYADGGDLPSALRLFSLLPRPNIFAWTPILAFLSRSGHHLRCLSAYSRMRSAGIPSDPFVLPLALRSSSSSSSSSAAAALHSDAVKFAAAANLHVANALIAAYARSGDLPSADRVFASMDRRDLLSWNAAISALASTGSADRALALVRSMPSDGCEPDVVTWNAVMDGCCRAGRCAEAVRIFDGMVGPNAVSYTIIIVGLGRSGNHEAALGFFRRMVSGGAGAVPPDQDALSCAVACCRHVGALRAGREVHARGIKTLDPAAFYCSAGAALVALYAGSKAIASAERVFGLMDPTDMMKRNALIGGLTRAGMAREALEQFREMQSRGVGTDATTLASVLPACSMMQGKEIHAHAMRSYYELATEVYNALISVYARSGCIAAARSVFSAACPARDVVTWNAMITAYGSHGLGGPAIELAWGMMRAGPRPNAITFTSVLAACSHAGLVDRGLEWFERFRNDVGLDPNMAQYSCVVDMLGRAGRFEEAVGFIRRMPFRAEASIWGALMAASRAHQNVEFGKLAFEELLKVEPENAGNYVTMAGMYGRAGRWEEAKMVRKMMERSCVVKPSGYSWV